MRAPSRLPVALLSRWGARSVNKQRFLGIKQRSSSTLGFLRTTEHLLPVKRLGGINGAFCTNAAAIEEPDAQRCFYKFWLPEDVFASNQDVRALIAGPGGAHLGHVLQKYPTVELNIDGQCSTSVPQAQRLHVSMSSKDSGAFEAASVDILDLVETVCDMVGEELGYSEDQVARLIGEVRAEKHFEAPGIHTPLDPVPAMGQQVSIDESAPGFPGFLFNSGSDSQPLSMQTSQALIQPSLQDILAALPAEWRGTTYNNSNLLGREGFGKKLEELIARKNESGEKVQTQDLHEIGYAEDYLRVASNVSTVLELVLAQEKGLDITQVLSFASEVLPIISICFASKLPVKLYLGNGKAPFRPKDLELLRQFGVNLECYPSSRIRPAADDEIVVCLEQTVFKTCPPDAIIAPGLLYIMNTEKVVPGEVLKIRKRMSTPMTTPVAEGMLQRLAGQAVTSKTFGPGPTSPPSLKFYAHMQRMCGTPVDQSAQPVVSTVGLSNLSSLWMNLIGRGGADVLMCSTAYGGSCQLADIFEGFTTQFRKHEFHIQDKGTSVVAGIQAQLAKLADRTDLLPTTVIFLEAPTNPDMKVPDLGDLVSMIQLYKRASGREVMLLVDATFAPGSKVMQKLRDLDEDLIVMCFISLSKSVSRGLTTGGALIANHTPAAKEILGGVADACQMLDLIAKPDQLMRLVDNHGRTEERCQQAYALAVEVGEKLYESVRQTTGYDMPLAFVTPEEAAMGFTTGTISFNLPCRPGASPKQNEALAQQFVDALCVHSKLFKPCVSFGQDNGLVYCTVPATSTQGAVKAEDKEKQAVGGVQLCRLSFPATCDVEAISRIISDGVTSLYK